MLSTIDTWWIGWRLLLFAAIALATHAMVMVVKFVAKRVARRLSFDRFRKLRTLGTLFVSVAVFTLYFLAFGFMLRELGVSLTAYLASASVVGLAIGFGSQGVVQDVVTGLTFIFSDLIDVGDLVEVSGQTGVVKAITMRFVELENAMGARVFIPNRTISNVINYPRGYVRCLVDVTLLGNPTVKDAMASIAADLMKGMSEQFPGILITTPSLEGRYTLGSGKEFVRLKFRIWPNRGQPIETTFCKEMTAMLKTQNNDYQDWMIAVSYEAERRVSVDNKGERWFSRTTS